MHVAIALLVFLGSMGFPIVFNLYRYLKVQVTNLVHLVRKDVRREHFPKLISINSRLALVMSGVLLTIGFVAFSLF